MNITYPDGATPLDPDEKEGLKQDYITTREELNRWEQRNIADGICEKLSSKGIIFSPV